MLQWELQNRADKTVISNKQALIWNLSTFICDHSVCMRFTVSRPYHKFNPEAPIGTPVPQLIHQSRPPVSEDRGHPQGTGTSVWNTQQDHRDPLRTRQSKLDRAVKVLGMSSKTFSSVKGRVVEHWHMAQTYFWSWISNQIHQNNKCWNKHFCHQYFHIWKVREVFFSRKCWLFALTNLALDEKRTKNWIGSSALVGWFITMQKPKNVSIALLDYCFLKAWSFPGWGDPPHSHTHTLPLVCMPKAVGALAPVTSGFAPFSGTTHLPL